MAVDPDPDPYDADPYDPDPVYDPWYRRYWGYYNRPYGGCGCLYTVLLFLILLVLLSLFVPALDPVRFWEVDEGLQLLFTLL